MFRYIYQNMGNLLVSLCGFIIIGVLLEETSEKRYNKIVTWVTWMAGWSLRYFGFSLFVSNYLAKLYQDEMWFSVLFLFLNIWNAWLGMVLITVLFRGSLVKNMVTVLATEVVFTMLTSLPMILLNWIFYGQAVFKWRDYMTPLVWLIPLESLLIYRLIKTRFNDYLKAYACWESSHPLLMNLFVAGYLVMGMISNISFAKKGVMTTLLFILMVVLCFGYFWYDYLNAEWIREESRHLELLYREKSMRLHYDHAVETGGKIREYNREIRESLEQLMTRVKKEDAAHYLAQMQKRYDELFDKEYYKDYQINQMLLHYEKECRELGIQTAYYLQTVPPDFISSRDMGELLRWLLEGMIKGLRAGGNGMTLLLQAGITGNELIISCQARGRGRMTFSRGYDIRTSRRLLKKLHADVSVKNEAEGVRVIIGVPRGQVF
ncbi:MAG: hypothetical protein IJ137_05585 [Eubacterium sp.]|nr:hypothetical protein [Eubacterium sp.]